MRVIKKLAVVATFSVIGILFCEFFLRVFLPQPLYSFEQGLFIPDARVGYKLAPLKHARHTQPDYSYVIETDDSGFRGPKPSIHPTYTVVIIGDSFAFGMGVPEGRSAIDILRSKLAAWRPGSAIINTAVPGYSLINERSVLEEALAQYHPNLILHFFCWNDFGEDTSLKVRNGYLVISKDQKLSALHEYLSNHSHLYALIKRVYYGWCHPNNIADKAPNIASSDWTVRQIAAMKQLSSNAGARYLLMIQPFGGPAEVSISRVKRDFISKLTQDGVDAVDLGALFDTLSPDRRKRMTFRSDPHWSIEGNAFVADILSEKLEKISNGRMRK